MFSFFAPLTPTESPENVQLYKDSVSDTVAPVDPNELVYTDETGTVSREAWKRLGWAGDITPSPEPIWVCELYGMGKEQAWYTNKAPNWFWRLMQRLILGNRWRKL